MKKYAKNLGIPPVVGKVMMLLPASANACPPFYPPTHIFAKAKVGELAIIEPIK